jgi:HK97 family phage portal protein
MNAFQFWNRVMTWALNWGTAYVYIDQDSQGTPLALLPLLPDRTYPARMNGRLWIMTDVSGYSTPVMLPVNRVLRIEGLNTNNIEAVDTMRQARNSLALSLANEKFASKFFKHGGRVGGILELPTATDKVARDKIEEGFRKTYEGADNPFKTIVLRDNAKFHAAQTSPRDSQMIEANESQVRQVARWFNLSPSKLGLSDSVSYNSKAEDNQAYLSSTLERWLVQIAQECNAKLLRPEEKATHFFEHNTRALLRMNPKDEAEVLRTYREIGVLSSNEVRQVLNLLPRDGGDSYENPNTTSGASATTKETPAEAIDAKDMPTPNPQRAKILAVLGAKARDKAKRSTAMVEWVDSGFARDKAAWQKEYGEQPPADVVEEIRTKLAKILETTHESQLWVKVDELFKNLEK